MVGSGDGGNGGGGQPHVGILYSDKLCGVDKPPALNKPVAAPGGGAFNADNGKETRLDRECCQAGRRNRCSCSG